MRQDFQWTCLLMNMVASAQVPLKMVRGELPRSGLLLREGLPQYLALEEAMRSGSVRALNQALTVNQHRFIMEVRTGCRASGSWGEESIIVCILCYWIQSQDRTARYLVAMYLR